MIAHEGLELKPYNGPAGKLTIGVGRNLEDKGITKKEAVMLLEDVSRMRNLGWEPGITLEKGIHHTYDWYKTTRAYES